MTQKYPEICPQNLIEPWWEKCDGDGYRPGRLIWAHLPHTDQDPYTLEAVGRDVATEHQTANFRIKKFNVGARIQKRNLPVAAMPLYAGETFCIYRTKKRPAIILSKGGSKINDRLTRNMAKWRTNPTILAAPSYGNKGGFNEEFCDRIRRIEYPHFMWDLLPIDGRGIASIFRFDHIQPIGRSKNTIEFTPYCLSLKAIVFIREWIDWLFSGQMEKESELCQTRETLMGC